MALTPSYILRLTRAAFRQEAEELLTELDTSLLRLEATPSDRSLVDRVFRVMHTMKGSGATAGFHEVSAVLHDVEDIFNSAREGRLAITTAIIDCVLPITDLIKRMMGATDPELPELVAEGARLVGALKLSTPQMDADAHRRPEGVPSIDESLADSSVWAVRFRPYEGFFRTGNDPLFFLKELQQLGPGVVKVDRKRLELVDQFDPEASYLSWEIQIASEASEAILREVFAFAEGEADIDIQTLASANAWVLPAEAYFEKQMLADFLEECGEDVAEVEGLTLQLEQRSDSAARLGELRRILHNLKGLARLLLGSAQRVPPPHHPLRAIGELCHAAEGTLADGAEAVDDGERFGRLLELVDRIRGLSQAVVVGGDDGWPSDLLTDLKGCAGPDTNAPLPKPTDSVVLEVGRQYQEIVSAVIRQQPDDDVASPEDLRMLSRALRTLGNAAEFEGNSALSRQIAAATTTCGSETTPPHWAEIRRHVRDIEIDLAACRRRATAASSASVAPVRSSGRPIGRTVSLRPEAQSMRAKQSAAPTGVHSMPQGPAAPGQAVDLGRSIRVDHTKLDRLMQSVSELLIAKNALPVLAHRIETQEPATTAKDIKDLGVRITHIADDLQDAMRQVRMLPIRTVFQKFPRMIRDLARALGRQVQLIVSGEETELDRTVLEQIGDPLVHLIRNAVDHGIEAPEERLRQQKSEMGTIGLEVSAEGTDVLIRVSDDGRGMDPVRLKKKAVEKHLITQSAADALSDQQALELVFLPGLSTAEAVTNVSGRGVGMDVVQNNVRALRGNISLSSALGSGTVFAIKLPSSVMVSRGVLVESDGEQYVLPIDAVREMVKLRTADLRMHRDRALAAVRGNVHRVVSLSNLLGLRGKRSGTFSEAELNAMLLATEGEVLAVVVDRLVAEVDVVAKPLPVGYDRSRIFRGATILGDGRVALVLEPVGFARLLTPPLPANESAVTEPFETRA